MSRRDDVAASPPYYEADNVGRLYRVTDGAGVHPTGVTVPEWASRNDITPAEFDARVATAAQGHDEVLRTKRGRTKIIQRYGVELGRLWIRWPYFEPRDVWIGVYVKERYREMGELHQVVYVCPIPTLVLLLDWTVRRGE